MPFFVHENRSANLIPLVGMRVWVHEFCVLGYIYEVHFHCSFFFFFVVLKVDLSTCLGCDACPYGACVFEQFYTVRFLWRPFFRFYTLYMKYLIYLFFIFKDLVAMCSPFASIASC